MDYSKLSNVELVDELTDMIFLEQIGRPVNELKLGRLVEEAEERDPRLYRRAIDLALAREEKDVFKEVNALAEKLLRENIEELSAPPESITLKDYLKIRKGSFFAKVDGESMKDAGILEGDIVVADRTIPLSPGRIIVLELNGRRFIKRYRRDSNGELLISENSDYDDLRITDEMDFRPLGVVVSLFRNL